MTKNEDCQSCRFWRPHAPARIIEHGDGTRVEVVKSGDCRRLPPVFRPAAVYAMSPHTSPFDWCGEFQPK